jgi:hypothetical protein
MTHVGATTDKKAIEAFLDKWLEVTKDRPDLPLNVPGSVKELRSRLRKPGHGLSISANGSLLIGDCLEIRLARQNT